MMRCFPTAALAAILVAGAAPTHAADPTQPVTIRFAGMVGDKVFACGESYPDIGATRSTVTPSDFRLFVSDLRLIDADGRAVPVTLDQDGKWQQRAVALLDFENKAGPCANGTVDRRDIVTGTVPTGRYAGLAFTVGVPPALNHQDATLAESPLNLTAMFWNWQGGYKFLRIDMATRGLPQGGGMRPAAAPMPAMAGHGAAMHGRGEAAPGFVVHLGSTGCDTGPRGATGAALPTCSSPNRVEVLLPRFDTASDTVAIDLAALLRDTDVDSNQPQTAPGCMSEPHDRDCAGIMARLGLAFGGAPAAGQSAIRVK